jgi:hypothetical protein
VEVQSISLPLIWELLDALPLCLSVSVMIVVEEWRSVLLSLCSRDWLHSLRVIPLLEQLDSHRRLDVVAVLFCDHQHCVLVETLPLVISHRDHEFFSVDHVIVSDDDEDFSWRHCSKWVTMALEKAPHWKAGHLQREILLFWSIRLWTLHSVLCHRLQRLATLWSYPVDREHRHHEVVVLVMGTYLQWHRVFEDHHVFDCLELHDDEHCPFVLARDFHDDVCWEDHAVSIEIAVLEQERRHQQRELHLMEEVTDGRHSVPVLRPVAVLWPLREETSWPTI